VPYSPVSAKGNSHLLQHDAALKANDLDDLVLPAPGMTTHPLLRGKLGVALYCRDGSGIGHLVQKKLLLDERH
jgi:hypothetical protein